MRHAFVKHRRIRMQIGRKYCEFSLAGFECDTCNAAGREGMRRRLVNLFDLNVFKNSVPMRMETPSWCWDASWYPKCSSWRSGVVLLSMPPSSGVWHFLLVPANTTSWCPGINTLAMLSSLSRGAAVCGLTVAKFMEFRSEGASVSLYGLCNRPSIETAQACWQACWIE